MAKIGRTENSYTVPGSKFPEYSENDRHFAVAPPKTSVFDEKLYFGSLTNFQKVIFQKNKKINIEISIKHENYKILFKYLLISGNPYFFRTGGSMFFVRSRFFLEPELSGLAASSKKTSL